jgi:hypothetical protein
MDLKVRSASRDEDRLDERGLAVDAGLAVVLQSHGELALQFSVIRPSVIAPERTVLPVWPKSSATPCDSRIGSRRATSAAENCNS